MELLIKGKVLLRLWFLVMFMAKNVVAYNEALRTGSVVYGITTMTDGSNVSDDCARDLNMFANSLDNNEDWAVNLFDYSGKSQAPFTLGRTFWFGSEERCNYATDPTGIKTSLTYGPPQPLLTPPPYGVGYKMAYFQYDVGRFSHSNFPHEDKIQLGLCLPTSCSSDDIFTLLQRYFDARIFYAQSIYKTNFTMLSVKPVPGEGRIESLPVFITMVVILGASIAMAAIGTVYDVYIWTPKTRRPHSSSNNNPEPAKNDMEIRLAMKENNGRAQSDLTVPGELYEQSALGKCLMCFSVNKNRKILQNNKIAADSISCIHGIRFLGMVWIIFLHTALYGVDSVDNKIFPLTKQKYFLAQVINNGTFSVATFYFMSGFLVAYLYHNGLRKRGTDPISSTDRITGYFWMILQRYARLTPTYAVTIGISGLTWWYMYQNSAFLMFERNDLTCANYWYRNLLYINTFYPRDEMCLSWSWYMSNDMQFFVLSSALVVLSAVWFKVTAVITISLLIASCAATGYISYINNYIPLYLDSQYELIETMYDPPWTWISTNLVGVCTGYWVANANGKLHLNKNTIRLIWTASSLMVALVLFIHGLPSADKWMTVETSAVYMTFGRTLWACGIAWVVIACSTGHGGLVNSILSWPYFVPLSRLTYSAYLINPLVIASTFLSAEIPTHAEYIALVLRFIGIIVVVFFVAVWMTLLFETPSILLIRMASPTISKAVKSEIRSQEVRNPEEVPARFSALVSQ